MIDKHKCFSQNNDFANFCKVAKLPGRHFDILLLLEFYRIHAHDVSHVLRIAETF